MRRRIHQIALLLVAAATAVIAVRLVRPPERVLLARSRRLVSLPPRSGYSWLSGGRLFVLRSPRGDTPPMILNPADGASGVPFGAVATSGIADPTRRAFLRGLYLFGSPDPRGSHLAGPMPAVLGRSRVLRWRSGVLPQGGRPRAPWPDSLTMYVSEPLWFPNGERWVTLACRGWRGPSGGASPDVCAVTEELASEATIRTVPIGRPRGSFGKDHPNFSQLLGWVRPGRVLAAFNQADYSTTGSPYRQIRFYEFNVSAPPELAEYSIRLPKGPPSEWDGDTALGSGESIDLSPDGRRLAWMIHVSRPLGAVPGFLSRWIPSIRASHWIEVRTSSVTGPDMRVVGSMDVRPGAGGAELPVGLSWMPDGKRLSFVYKDALWALPAE